MGGKETRLSLVNEREIVKGVPKYIRAWIRREIDKVNSRTKSKVDSSLELREDSFLSEREVELLIAFVTDTQTDYFWKWVGKNIRQVKTPIKKNLIQFMVSAAHLVKITNSDIRKRNAKLYYKEKIKEIQDVKERLSRAEKYIRATGLHFTTSQVRRNFSRSDRENIFSSANLAGLNAYEFDQIMRRSEKQLLSAAIFHLELSNRVLDQRIAFHGLAIKDVIGPGKANDPNAASYFYCRQLIEHFQLLINERVPYRPIADLTNLFIKGPKALDAERVRQIVREGGDFFKK